MMIQYIARRIFTSIPVLLGILFLTFALARLIPGDPCRAILGEKATKALCDQWNYQHGLTDQNGKKLSVFVQFPKYLGEVLQGDFGSSIRYGMPVTRMLEERLPTTVELSFAALFVSMIVGIPLGVL
ncbi:MAG: ABC transporter permease, partial [Chloroflexota bacterium]